MVVIQDVVKGRRENLESLLSRPDIQRHLDPRVVRMDDDNPFEPDPWDSWESGDTWDSWDSHPDPE